LGLRKINRRLKKFRKELHDLYSLPNVVIVIKSRKDEMGRILSTQWGKEKFIEAAVQNNIFSNTAVRTINLVTDKGYDVNP
jgi:hypothetical protein